MKNLILLFALATTRAASQVPAPCTSPAFSDTALYFFISEIKPFGSDRFVEVYNCRDSARAADRWYVRGMYSDRNDSSWTGVVAPHAYTVIPLPDSLAANDAISIVARTDTFWTTMAAVVYLIHDSTKSSSLCDWFQELPPTPGAPNACVPVVIAEIHGDNQPVAVYYFTLLGQKLEVLPSCGWYMIYEKYLDGTTIMRKKFRTLD